MRTLPLNKVLKAGPRNPRSTETVFSRGASRNVALYKAMVDGVPKHQLDPRKLFEFSGQICHELRDPSDRELLSRRLGQYLNGRRRGRLRLPHRFPESIRALTLLSRCEIRAVAYWVKPSMSANCTVDHRTAGIIHGLAPGMMWTRITGAVAPSLETVVKRLPRTQVPRVTRAVWPSSPDIFEVLEMSRRGKNLPPRDKLPLTVPNCITKKSVSDDIRLASGIVRQQIVGVRLNMGVPEKFLGYFRRHHGFLILVSRYKIPAGLVRFLLSLWIRTPTSLWLVENCRFKRFLKRHVPTDFVRGGSVSKDGEITDDAVERVGSPLPPSEEDNLPLTWPPWSPEKVLYFLAEVDLLGLYPNSANDKRRVRLSPSSFELWYG
jgi:hypothetical protein